MAYGLHIKRKEKPITLEEWISSVEMISGARIEESQLSAINPKSGQTITVSGSPGNVAVLYKSGGFLGIGATETWETTIWFSNGRGSFVATDQVEMPSDPTRLVVVRLAQILSAEIVGDEGEVYHW